MHFPLHFRGEVHFFIHLTLATHPSKRKARKSPASRKKLNKKSAGNSSMSKRIRYFITAIIICLFSAAFYYFYIRPYAYRWKPCYGFQAYDVCIPFGYAVHGMDISRYQGCINWAEVARQKLAEFPLHFIFIKATEGGDHLDTTFVRNFNSAREHGLIRGAYHFFSPYTDPLKQADFFINTVALKQGDLPPVLDIEITGKKNKDELQEALKVWLKRTEAHYGVKPIIYASYKFKMKYLNDSLLNTYPYWIAHYYVDSVRYEGNWHFWQHTDVARVPGIDGAVDLNVFNGTLEELKELTLR